MSAMGAGVDSELCDGVHVSDDILDQLAALTARLAEQEATIERLTALVATPVPPASAAPTVTPAAPDPAPRAPVSRPGVGRRGLLTRILGATAAAALLTVANEAATAEANSLTTVSGASTSSTIGLIVSHNSIPSGLSAPQLGSTTMHGTVSVTGLQNLSPVKPPDFNSGVLGIGAAQFANVVGVHGLSEAFHAVYGKTFGSGVNVSGVTGVASAGATNGVYGINSSTSDQAAGVYATATEPPVRLPLSGARIRAPVPVRSASWATSLAQRDGHRRQGYVRQQPGRPLHRGRTRLARSGSPPTRPGCSATRRTRSASRARPAPTSACSATRPGTSASRPNPTPAPACSRSRPPGGPASSTGRW